MSSVIVLEYQFSDVGTWPPSGNQIRLDADHPYTAVTRCWVRNITSDGADMRTVLLAMPVGSSLYVQDKNDNLAFVRMVMTTAPLGPIPDAVEFIVNWTDNGTAIPNQACLLILIPVTTTPEPEAPTGPLAFGHVVIAAPLIPLADAKAHLHITDPARDAEIDGYTVRAQNEILAYLKSGADPLWTASTVPYPVRSAILLLLTHRYEHRGDAMEPDEALWTALERVLVGFRDPALA